jgi:hypothetical protein
MLKRFLSFGLLVSCALSAVEIKILQHLTPYEIFGLVERVKIAAFSTDSFSHAGVQHKEVAQWQELTDALNVIVLQEVIAESDRYYKITKELERVCAYIVSSIEALYTGDTVRPAFAQKYWLNMHALQEQMFQEIRRATKPGADWINAIPHGQILTAQHAAVLKDFKYMAKQAHNDGSPLRESEIQGLLKLHKLHSKMQVNVLIDNLEQYCYRKEKDARYARQLITLLAGLYPEILSSYDMSILVNTQDKVHTIIFAQASAYENILHQLLREMNGD